MATATRPQNLEELYQLLNDDEAKELRTYLEQEEVCKLLALT